MEQVEVEGRSASVQVDMEEEHAEGDGMVTQEVNAQQEGDGMVSQEQVEVEGQAVGSSKTLKEILAEVESGINEILDGYEDPDEIVADEGGGVTQAEHLNPLEPKFDEGKAGDVLPEKLQLNEEDVTFLLEAGYTVGELEGCNTISMPVDDMSSVEMMKRGIQMRMYKMKKGVLMLV